LIVEVDKVGDNVPSGRLSQNLSIQQADSDSFAPAITEEDFMQDLRDPEVVRFEKTVLVNDSEINNKVFAAWAQTFNLAKLQ
jgi:hypothetical protein